MSVPITPGSGVSSVAADVISGLNYQQIKIVGGETGSTSVLGVTPDGAIRASIIGTPTVTFSGAPSISGTVNIGTIPGSVVSFQGGAWTHSVVGNVGQTGTIITSVSGTATVVVTGSVLTIYSPTASLISGVTSIVTSTGQTSVTATVAGGQRAYLTNILVTNGAGAATFVDIMSGATVMYSGFAAASGGGFAASFPVPLQQPHTATSIDMKSSAQASVKVAVSGFTAP